MFIRVIETEYEFKPSVNFDTCRLMEILNVCIKIHVKSASTSNKEGYTSSHTQFR